MIGEEEMVEEFKKMMRPKSSAMTWNKRKEIPLYADTGNLYQNYFNLWINLRYMEFNEFDNISYSKVFNPGDMQELIDLLAK